MEAGDSGPPCKDAGEPLYVRRNHPRPDGPAAVFVTGVLVGLCTVPCTGGIYLGILALLSAQGSATGGVSLLILYNVMFVLPLVAVLTLVTSRFTYRGVARWHLRTKGLVKVLLGLVMLALGLGTLIILT